MLTGLPNGNPLVTRPSSKKAEQEEVKDVKMWTAPCPGYGEGATCTFYQGLDYDQGFIGKTPNAGSEQDCCNLCAADPTDCYAASFASGICYFKPSGKPFTWKNGVISVFPPGSVAPPTPSPTPPPPRTIETHG